MSLKIKLVQPVGIAVSRNSGIQLATCLVGCYFHRSFLHFFPFYSVTTFSHRMAPETKTYFVNIDGNTQNLGLEPYPVPVGHLKLLTFSLNE